MKKNKKAVSLIIVMGIVLVTGLLAITIIELIIPFSRSVSGMENSSKAYYLANAGVEEAMLNIKKNNENSSNPIVSNKKFDINSSNPTGNNISLTKSFSDRILTVEGNAEPKAGKGDSDHDKNKEYNIISVGNPIQMDLTGINPNNFQIFFRIPTINSLTYKLEGTKIYINWQITSEDGFLNSPILSERYGNQFSGRYRTKVLFGYNINNNSHTLSSFHGINKDGNPQRFSDFFYSNCTGGKKCILKFSIANELIGIHPTDSTKKTILPYLEWKTYYNGGNYKLRYSTIESTGKSNNFVKKLEVKVPQATVNEAFDFTVFQ